MSFRRSIYKSAGQLRKMVVPGRVTADALGEVRNACRVGVSTRELDDLARSVIVGRGGESNFAMVPGYRHSTCVSVNDVVVHGIPSDRVLEAGDIVSVDCGAMVDGWNGDAAFTVVLDDPQRPEVVDEREELSRVTEGALWRGIACLAQAKNLNEVGGAIEDYVRSVSGFGILVDYVGHGIGRRMHEEPPVFNYRVAEPGVPVRAGLVVAIEPMLVVGSGATYVADDGWAVVTTEGGSGAHWEHTVAVHEDGVWVLTATDGGVSALAPFGVTPVPFV